MAQKRSVRFFVLRYAPSLLRNKFVNIGLFMLEQPESSGGFCCFRHSPDWQQVQSVVPDLDVKLLDALMRELQVKLEAPTRGELLETMHDSFSNTIQVSPWKECLTDDPKTEFENLFSIYLKDQIAVAYSETL